MHEHLSIAPAPLLLQEWKYLQSREVLRTTWDVEEMIFLQSLASRAHEGHGSFHGRRFVDTAEDDVAQPVRLAMWLPMGPRSISPAGWCGRGIGIRSKRRS